MQPICAGVYCSKKSTNREMPPSDVFLQELLDDLSLSLNYKAFFIKQHVSLLLIMEYMFVTPQPEAL